jgi:hypothetical protein
MSTTTVSQPNSLSSAAMYSAFAMTWSSVTAPPKQSQLFQPMGGRFAASFLADVDVMRSNLAVTGRT